MQLHIYLEPDAPPFAEYRLDKEGNQSVCQKRLPRIHPMYVLVLDGERPTAAQLEMLQTIMKCSPGWQYVFNFP